MSIRTVNPTNWSILAASIAVFILVIHYFSLPHYWLFAIPVWLTLACIEKFQEVTFTATFRLGIPLLIGALVYIGYLEIHEFHEVRYFRASLVSTDKLSNFFLTIVATLYAICMAFLLWKGLADFDNLKNAMRDEANSVSSITQFLTYFDDAAMDINNAQVAVTVKENFLEYVKRTNNKERQSLEGDGALIRANISEIGKLRCNDVNDQVALGNIMTALNELMLLRSRRTSFMKNQMSPYLMATMIMMSVAVLVPFSLEDPRSFSMAPFYLVILAVFFSFLFITLMDLNRPFNGYWRVRVGVFDRLEPRLEMQLQKARWRLHTLRREQNPASADGSIRPPTDGTRPGEYMTPAAATSLNQEPPGPAENQNRPRIR